MKNINNKEIQRDPIAEARKHPKFQEYAQDTKDRIELAIKIYDTRIKKGLSQQALAKEAKTTQKIISKIENCEINVGYDLITRVIRSLGLKLKVVDAKEKLLKKAEKDAFCLPMDWFDINSKKSKLIYQTKEEKINSEDYSSIKLN